jgi:hypothetical protein
VFKGSPAHVSALSGPATWAAIRPVIPGGRRRVDHVAAVSCRLSATGIRFLGILSRRGVLLPSRSAYQATSAWTPTGFPRSAHPSRDRIGCPLYPEAQRCSHDRSDPSGRRSPPLPGARPYRPGPHPISGAVNYEASSRVHSRSPARPSPSPGCSPGWNRGPWAHSPGFAPQQAGPAAHAGAGDGHRTLARSHMTDIVGPPTHELTQDVRPRVARSGWT